MFKSLGDIYILYLYVCVFCSFSMFIAVSLFRRSEGPAVKAGVRKGLDEGLSPAGPAGL